MNNGKFKGRNLEDRIVLWGHLDDAIMALRSRRAKYHWRKEGIPRPLEGGFFIVDAHIVSGKRMLNYDLVTINRFWWKPEFAKCDWGRIEKAFAKCVAIGFSDCAK